MSDYYEILQCDKDSSYENIKTKYHNLIRKFHPDKTGNDNTEQFINVREAWKTVCDPTKKRIYDESQLQEQKSKLFSESCDFNDLLSSKLNDSYTYPCRCGSEFIIFLCDITNAKNKNFESVQIPCSECSLHLTVNLKN